MNKTNFRTFLIYFKAILPITKDVCETLIFVFLSLQVFEVIHWHKFWLFFPIVIQLLLIVIRAIFVFIYKRRENE
jgi:NhaP-type Na+/H+ or K+/H+ antiporter